MLNLDEELERDSKYGDTAVRTMGELVAKANRVISGQSYGITQPQVYGLLQPNKQADIDRAVAYLQQNQCLSVAYLRDGGPPCYFPSGARLQERIEIAKRMANGGQTRLPTTKRPAPAG